MSIEIENNDLYIETFLFKNKEHQILLFEKNKAFDKDFIDYLKAQGVKNEL